MNPIDNFTSPENTDNYNNPKEENLSTLNDVKIANKGSVSFHFSQPGFSSISLSIPNKGAISFHFPSSFPFSLKVTVPKPGPDTAWSTFSPMHRPVGVKYYHLHDNNIKYIG
jgi:hypothetical protein